MSGRGYGVSGVRGVFAVAGGLLALSFASVSSAQSTASFPEPPSNSPRPSPASPNVPVPVPVPAPAASPTPAPDTTTDRRYPAVSASSLPPLSGSAFYPAILPYRDDLPIPPGYRVEHRSANGLIGGGLATLIASYGTAIIVGASDNFKNGTGWTVLPVIGPWAAIGARDYHCDNSATDVLKAQQNANACVRGAFNEVQTIAILSADAVVQATGAVLLIAGLASGRDELVRSDLKAGVRLAPVSVGANGFGIGFDGRF